MQPGPGISARRVEPGGIAPDLQHRVVDGVGCERRLTGNPQRHAVQGGGLKLIEPAGKQSPSAWAHRTSSMATSSERAWFWTASIMLASLLRLLENSKHRRPAKYCAGRQLPHTISADRTRSTTWITPLLWMTSGVVTWAMPPLESVTAEHTRRSLSRVHRARTPSNGLEHGSAFRVSATRLLQCRRVQPAAARHGRSGPWSVRA